MEAISIDRSAEFPGPLRGRGRPLAETLAVVGLLETALWSLRANPPPWANVGAYGSIVLILWASHERRRKEGLVACFAEVGCRRAWVEVLAAGVLLSGALLVAARLVGDANETFEFVFLDKPPAKLLTWVVGKFLAALGQQLALQRFLWPVCFELTRSRLAGAVLASAIFGLIHLPSPTLVAITSLAGLVWVGAYQRTGRLAPLILSHMILATLAHGALPERLTYDMRVGQSATVDMKRFEELNDPRIRRINRRLKESRADLKFYTSQGYYDAQGGNLPGFIRGIFRDVLDRQATDSDVAFWTTRKLANPRVELVNVLLASDEHAVIRQARRLEGRPSTTRR